jgi:molybdopterin-guanine dinucleotide biosynthesis protein B
LIEEFTRRGLKVASVKHAHHAFQIDTGDTDSARHRRAGAVAVAIVSASRWALIKELGDAPEPELEEVLPALAACDLILVEGYKGASIPKLEARRRDALAQRPLAATDPAVIAIAADHETEGHGRPVFSLDDIAGIADFLATAVPIPPAQQPKP